MELPEVLDELSREIPRILSLVPRLVHRLKSPKIFDDDSLIRWVSRFFGIEPPRVKVEVYRDLVHRGFCGDSSFSENLDWFLRSRMETTVSWLLATRRVFKLFDGPLIEKSELSRFLVKFFLLSLMEKGEKVLKFHLAYIFSRTSRQPDLEEFVKKEKPQCEVEIPGNLFGGKSHKWIVRKLFLRRFSSKSAQIAYTFLQSKRAWNPISKVLEHESLLKHRKALCEPRELIFDEQLLQEVNRTVFEVFRGKRHSGNERVPSSSAHFGVKRKDGGAQMVLKEREPFDHSEFIGFGRVRTRVFELRGYPRDAGWCSSLQAMKFQAARFLLGWDKGEDFAFDGRDTYDAEVHTVLEPAKARIITAGPALEYHRCRSLQKTIHSVLRKHPVFQLVGKPLDSGAMEWFSSRVRLSETCYLSADYSAATDNLHPELIEECADAIVACLRLGDADAHVYRNSLLNHRLQYPEWAEIEDGEQCWGQLMGSPSSFPVLCLINAAVNRYFYEKCRREEGSLDRALRLDEVPMLVNGDDLLCVIDPKNYQKWWDLVRSVGLEPSLGKNYVSEKFAMINSELWMENKDFFGNHAFWNFVPFMNLGLLRGQGKVLSDTRRTGHVERVRPGDIIANAESLLRGFSGEQREMLYSEFLKGWRTKIDTVLLKGQNWFLPFSLGGLGLPLPERFSVTRGQAKLARYLSVKKDFRDIPRLRSFKPSYLQKEDSTNPWIKDLEYEWVREKPEIEIGLTQYFDSYWGCPEEQDFVEQEREDLNHRKKWETLWKKGTDHSLSPMSIDEIRSWQHVWRVPKDLAFIVIDCPIKSKMFGS